MRRGALPAAHGDLRGALTSEVDQSGGADDLTAATEPFNVDGHATDPDEMVAGAPAFAGDSMQASGDALDGVEQPIVGHGPAAVDGDGQRAPPHVSSPGTERPHQEECAIDVIDLVSRPGPALHADDPPIGRQPAEPELRALPPGACSTPHSDERQQVAGEQMSAFG